MDQVHQIEVMPEPVPAQWVLKQIEVFMQEEDSALPVRKLATVLEIYTPVGVHISFWADDSSAAMAKEMNRLANFNRLGIWDPQADPARRNGGATAPGEANR
jgi:hypothetical protein